MLYICVEDCHGTLGVIDYVRKHVQCTRVCVYVCMCLQLVEAYIY